MSSEDDLKQLQEETWPDMNKLDQGMMGVHRTVRLEVPLHASGAIQEASRLLRGLADNLDRIYALKGPQMTERSLILQMVDVLWGAQARLNALCPWRREYKRRMALVRQDRTADPIPLSRYKS